MQPTHPEKGHPPFVVRSTDLPEEESKYPPPFDTEGLSFSRDLGGATGSRSLGLWRERIPPGRRTSFTHAHLREEEMVYVLSGNPSVRWVSADGSAPQEHPLSPGDAVTFVAGSGIAHTLVNRSHEDAEVLVVGERRPGERVWYAEDDTYAAWHAEQKPHHSWAGALGPEPDAVWPAVRVETDRLVLRPWTPTDIPALIATQRANREHLLPWMPWAKTVPARDEMLALVHEWDRQRLAGRDVVYGVFDPKGRIVGGTGLHDRIGPFGLEIGYWVTRAAQGQGYVTEWCAALVRLGFEVLGRDRMEIHCHPANVRSAAVAERLGFRHEATLPRRTVGLDGEPQDMAIYTLYRSDLDGTRSATAAVRAWDALGRRLI